VPLFVEELTRSVLDCGTNDAADQTGEPDGAYPIPTTLHGLLLARLDRLERGKAVAQAGAVIGREFSFQLRRMALDIDEPTLVSALDQLVASGLVFRRGSPPQASFIFKHALVRDAAYDMLVRRERRKLHAVVARCYEQHFAEIVEAQPELLAYHHRRAGNPTQSIGYLLAAAERALLRSATTEALSHLAQARELTSTLAEHSERLPLELKQELHLVGR
jgi:predicted ATPase